MDFDDAVLFVGDFCGFGKSDIARSRFEVEQNEQGAHEQKHGVHREGVLQSVLY